MAETILLYIEATSGVSGDMLLGAFLDSGVPVEILFNAWSALNIDNYEIEIFETQKSGMRALQCRVKTEEQKGPKTWKQFRKLLQTSELSDHIREQTLQLVERLFQLEAIIHSESIDRLHLHEMGGTDLLIDVVGTLAAVEHLQPSQIRCSPINTGKGVTRFSHGEYSVPAPVTTKLLEGLPVFQNDVQGELTTPTGALLLKHIVDSFGELQTMSLQKVGTGAGEKDIPGHPNVLRIFMGTPVSAENEIQLIETNIDDSSPQILAHFMERAFEQGALDVFFTPIFMKKNRPAMRLTVLTPGSDMENISQLVFAETSAIGLRHWKVDRKTLERKWKTIRIGDNDIRVKESYLNGTLYNYQPEFEDCKKAAARLKRPLKEVISMAIHAYLSL
jgi:uncharacterized protein (TIGR00299 family) protein